jgi:hypothetical protein
MHFLLQKHPNEFFFAKPVLYALVRKSSPKVVPAI